MTEFEEYLRGTFEINNGVENDVDNLVRIHAPELLKLAKKELMKDAIDTRIDKRLADMIGYTGSERVKVIIIKE